MAPQPDRHTVVVAAVYRDASSHLRRTAVGGLQRVWVSMGSWRDADVNRFVKVATPTMRAAIRQQSAITDAYLAALARAVTGAGEPFGMPDGSLAQLRGVPLEDVYHRPGETTWTAVAAGAGWEQAAQLGLARLVAIANTDLQLARTHTARAAMSADQRVTGYRRVTSGLCCELCDLASDQTYSTEDLMPIHNNCSCDVEPIFASEDPGELSTGQVDDLQGDRPVVHEHGELGPVLAVAGQRFTGPDDIG